MVFWPLHGIGRRFTEKTPYKPPVPVRSLGPRFRRSLHCWAVDAGCDNFLNFTVQALQTPQYNSHRFGIFWADTPRHADVIILLGPPLPALEGALRNTIEQIPRPRGILAIGGNEETWRSIVDFDELLAVLPEETGPQDLLGALLAAKGTIQWGVHP
jgi:Ni,Fe-hydrogenase III small subunit